MSENKIVSWAQLVVMPRMQFLALVITGLTIIFLGHRARSQFRSLEPAPLLRSITPEKMSQWGAEPTIVHTGLHITSFSEFNLEDNDFLADFIVWFEFDPAIISLDTVGKFSFNKGEILRKSEPRTKMVDGKFFVQYEVRVKFASNLTHQFFPLDDHRIFITLVNAAATPKEIVYQADKSGFSLSDNIFIRGWSLYDHHVDTGYEEWELDEYEDQRIVRHPKVIFALDFYRSGVRHILLILLPLFLIFFVGLFAFSFDPAPSDSLTIPLTTGSIASLIAYRFVIVNVSPNVGYFILSDHLFMLFLVGAFLAFILSMAMLRLRKKIKESGSSKHLETRWNLLVVARACMFMLFHAGVISAWYYLLFVWIR